MITFIIQFCSVLSLTKLSEIMVLGRLRLPKTIISEYRDTKNFYYKFLIIVYLITTTYVQSSLLLLLLLIDQKSTDIIKTKRIVHKRISITE